MASQTFALRDTLKTQAAISNRSAALRRALAELATALGSDDATPADPGEADFQAEVTRELLVMIVDKVNSFRAGPGPTPSPTSRRAWRRTSSHALQPDPHTRATSPDARASASRSGSPAPEPTPPAGPSRSTPAGATQSFSATLGTTPSVNRVRSPRTTSPPPGRPGEPDEGGVGHTPGMTAEQALADWCSGNSTELVDFRDPVVWRRDRDWNPKVYGWPRNKERALPPARPRRSWDSITTIMLHTTAVSGMHSRRGLGLPVHLFAPSDDAIVLCHPLELHLAHGHAANRFSVGLEISGESDWDTPGQVERARQIVRYFQAVRREHAGPEAPCFVMAHRQSHKSRGRDPGRPIWRDLGEWAVEELGFAVGPVVGSGRSLAPWVA